MAAGLQANVDVLGLVKRKVANQSSISGDSIGLYDQLITCESLRLATRKLYSDEHYARAVEEACKCLIHAVKVKSGLELDGVALIQSVFSEKKPVLKLNKLRNESQQNEQAGYMRIMSGFILGVRNPRAHEYQLSDSPAKALELLALTNHLMRIVEQSTRSRERNS